MANQNDSVGLMRELLQEFYQARQNRDVEKQVNVIIRILPVFERSEMLQSNRNFKKVFFIKMKEFIDSIINSASLQEEAKKIHVNQILSTMLKTFYEGYDGEPFDIYFYQYVNNNKIIPVKEIDNTVDVNEYDLNAYLISNVSDLNDHIKEGIKNDIFYSLYSNQGINFNGGRRKTKAKRKTFIKKRKNKNNNKTLRKRRNTRK